MEHGRQALAIAARNFYRQPDERVRFTGITGTNGKTTTAYLIDALLREAAVTLTGMIGTIEYRSADESSQGAEYYAGIAGRHAFRGGAGAARRHAT